ncbi:hypothetical protein [Sulfitobacter sp. MF3-043]|uniref:hypothetical protein n=1 Tax=Sulfitobacter sediminivivens TaxID=3252902 RepID=UPI0036D95032
MVQLARALPQSQVASLNLLKVVSSPTVGPQKIETRFVSVPLSNVRGTCGAMSGERLQSPDDFISGDEIRIASACHDHEASREFLLKPFDSFAEEDGEFIMSLSGCSQKIQILLMADIGILVGAYVITPDGETCDHPYLLLPRVFDPSRLYSVLDTRSI